MKKGDSIHKDKVGSQEWVEMATWCNDNGCYMAEHGDCYVIEGVPPYTPSPEDEIRECRFYLQDTDWVIDKISEEMLIGGDYKALINEYAPVIMERRRARRRLNELEDSNG